MTRTRKRHCDVTHIISEIHISSYHFDRVSIEFAGDSTAEGMAPKRKRQRLSAEAASVARKKLREMRANEMEAEASGTVFSHSQSE